MVALDTEEEVYVDNERDVFTLRSEAERGPRAIEEGGTHAYTCDARLEDEELEDGALNDAELDDVDLTHMYMHVSELGDDADDAEDEELADGEDEDEDDSEDEDDNNELEEVMDAVSELEDEEDRNDDMPNDLMRVKRYLSTLRRLDGITDRAFGALRGYTTEFLVNEGLLFRRAKLNMPPRKVIWDKNEQSSIIQQMHDESGHRGKKGTYQKVALRYWWKGLKKEWG